MTMVDNAWGLFGAAFGPVVILTLFWKRMTFGGALAGIISGAVVDIVWLMKLTAITGVYELLPAFVVGFIVAVIVSLCSEKPSREIEEIFIKIKVKIKELAKRKITRNCKFNSLAERGR